jgi:hypothetical protein
MVYKVATLSIQVRVSHIVKVRSYSPYQLSERIESKIMTTLFLNQNFGFIHLKSQKPKTNSKLKPLAS